MKNLKEEILQEFREKFIGYPPDGSIYVGMPTSFLCGEVSDLESFIASYHDKLIERVLEIVGEEVVENATNGEAEIWIKARNDLRAQIKKELKEI